MAGTAIQLPGEKIFLRSLTMEDVSAAYCAWLNDPEVNRYLETRFAVQTLASVMSYVETAISASDSIFLAIIEKATNLHIGNIKLGPILPYHRRGEISFFIGDKRCWGKGYATEAVRLLTEYAFCELTLVKVTAGCYSTNLGSKRVFEKLGYEQEAVFKKQYFSDGVWVNSYRFAKFRESLPGDDLTMNTGLS